ncbi:uncharacterized protein LOC144783134 [Lissotriton helveticus]
MMSIEEIININTNDNKPYQKPIRVNVINCSGKTTYKNAKQEQKILFHLALADKTGTMKCTCYQEELYEQTQSNCGLLIRNFIIKNKTILITKQTKVTKFPAMKIEEGLIQQAKNILHPPAPSASPIKDIKRATLKSLMTVSGTICGEEDVKTVFINGEDTPLKSITLKDATDDIKVTLWREATLFNIHLGDYVTLTHVTVHEFNAQKILNTTRHSKIEVTAPPQENIDIQIYGVESTKDETSMITIRVTNTDVYQSMPIQNDILIKWFMLDDEVDNIGNALILLGLLKEVVIKTAFRIYSQLFHHCGSFSTQKALNLHSGSNGSDMRSSKLHHIYCQLHTVRILFVKLIVKIVKKEMRSASKHASEIFDLN